MTEPPSPEPSPKLRPLKHLDHMVLMISTVTGQPPDEVKRRLLAEKATPGSSVAHAVAEAGVEPYVYGPAMERFYEQTDAFMYELAVWNMNRFKRLMARYVAKWIEKHQAPKLDHPARVLSLGDGLGFDGLLLNKAGFDVTYFEVPGYSAEFARRLFDSRGGAVRWLTNPEEIPRGEFDAVVCLDVLEHVPDPPAFARMLADYLAPGGVLFVHAPYYMIHPAYPTHVAASRVHSGSLRLYRDAGLRLLDGALLWNPIVLQKTGGTALEGSVLGRATVRLGQPYLMLGRRFTWPFGFIHRAKRFGQKWYR